MCIYNGKEATVVNSLVIKNYIGKVVIAEWLSFASIIPYECCYYCPHTFTL